MPKSNGSIPHQQSNVEILSGCALTHRLRGLNAAQRACVVEELATGQLRLQNLTRGQLARLCHVSGATVARVRVLTPGQRARVRLGSSLPPSSAQLKHTIRKAGVARAWGVIETML